MAKQSWVTGRYGYSYEDNLQGLVIKDVTRFDLKKGKAPIDKVADEFKALVKCGMYEDAIDVLECATAAQILPQPRCNQLLQQVHQLM